MLLKNKQTGEICDFKIIAEYDDCTSGWRLEKHDGTVLFYDHIDEIHKEWEDYEEPKEFWFIADYGLMCGHKSKTTNLDYAFYCEKDIQRMKAIGNYFETKEEAEKAAERLRAWKRLKDKGFRFVGWDKALRRHESCDFVVFCDFDGVAESARDLNLLFSQEDD